MRPRELQRFAQGKREAKTVHQAETESHHPAALQAGAAGDIFERHVHNRNGDECFDEGRKPQKVWREVVSGSNQRDRMRDGECGDDGNEGAEAAERNHQAKQKQEMIGTVKNVKKTEIDETQSCLVPTRVEPDDAEIAGEFERANSAADRQEPKYGDDAQAQPRKRRVNGKARLVRLDSVF